MVEYTLATVMGRKAEFFVFYRDCMDACGAVELSEMRELAQRGGLDLFMAGWVLARPYQSVVRDAGRLFLLTSGCPQGCFDFPLIVDGFAKTFDEKRAEFERVRPKWKIGVIG
jgi:hypothetical protein